MIGSKKDPEFGSVIVFGMGGIATEWFKDISVGFPSLNQVLARRLIERTAIYRHATSSGSLNLRLLEEVLVKFSQLLVDFPEIEEMDINPLIVNENTAVAVDARVDARAKDGTSVVLRPVKPEDETLFSELFKSLSEESMRFRFFHIQRPDS